MWDPIDGVLLTIEIASNGSIISVSLEKMLVKNSSKGKHTQMQIDATKIDLPVCILVAIKYEWVKYHCHEDKLFNRLESLNCNI